MSVGQQFHQRACKRLIRSIKSAKERFITASKAQVGTVHGQLAASYLPALLLLRQYDSGLLGIAVGSH